MTVDIDEFDPTPDTLTWSTKAFFFVFLCFQYDKNVKTPWKESSPECLQEEVEL